MKYNEKSLYEEERGHFKFDYYPYLIGFLLLLPILVITNIIGIYQIIDDINNDPDQVFKSILFMIIWDIFVPIGTWLTFLKFRGRAQFQLFENGFIPPRIPKNRRRPREKHFISIDEIEKMELAIFSKGKSFLENYINITLKDGSGFLLVESEVGRRGLKELMKFKEMHNIGGDRQVYHPALGWLKNEEIDQVEGLLEDWMSGSP